MKVEPKVITSVPPIRDAAEAPQDAAVQPEAQKPVPATVAGSRPEIRRDELDQIVEKMNETVKIFNRSLLFKVADSGRVIIKVVDEGSGEVIRQIPPESLVDMYQRLDNVIGLLFDRKV